MTHTSNSENRSIRRRAAVLSVLMHGLLLAAMVFMVDWKAVHVSPDVMQATLWDSLPSQQPAKSVVQPPAPQPEPEPKPEPKPVVPEKLTPPPQADNTEAQADIALKKQEDKKRKLDEEQRKEEEKLNKLRQLMRQQDEEERLKKVQDAVRQQDLEAQQAAAAAAEVDPSVLAYYVQKMKIKIRGNMIQSLCPASNPELILEMRLTQTGDIAGVPQLVKGSGDAVCNDAVLRAILASKPFELPTDDPAARNKLLDLLRLKLRPRG